jgi:hypothetical protein
MREFIDLIENYQLNESTNSFVYLGFREVEWATLALENNRLIAKSTQRFWDDGKRRKDDDPEYRNSYWMKGISTTRDLYFAQSWGDVAFKLNKDWITKRYKIIPFNWGYSIPEKGIKQHHKREREEFIVLKSNKDKYLLPDDEGGGLDTVRFMSPEGTISPLSSFLEGIYLHVIAFKNPKSELIINHPKFRGYYDFDNQQYPPNTPKEKLQELLDIWQTPIRKK